MTTAAPTTGYDDVPYPRIVHRHTHPDRLAATATLMGLEPAPPGRCRVLELGCAAGANLIPMAAALPDSQFVGLDLSARQIADGRAIIEAVGLRNINLRHQNLLAAGDDLGPFDYIIAHGLYSWVPPPVQDKILDLCGRHLTPHGVAHVSYDSYPIGHLRRMARDMMRYHARGMADPLARAARARELLALLAEAAPAKGVGYHDFLHAEHARLAPLPDGFLLHECLADVSEPVAFHEFAARAARYGLSYLGEADEAVTPLDRFPPPVAESLRRMDLIEREQYLDFLRWRAFRQTLLCRREASPSAEPMPERVASLFIASQARSSVPAPDLGADTPEEYAAPGGRVTLRRPLSKAALLCLAETWPHWFCFEELQAAARARLAGDAAPAGDSRELAEDLLRAFAGGAAELRAAAPRFVAGVSERPVAAPLARFHAARREPVVSMRHEEVRLDPVLCHLLCYLDGRHDRPALVEVLARFAEANGLVVEQDGQPVADPRQARAVLAGEVDADLGQLAAVALLVG
jgi:protein-L-isoaspartate O-methyltransferase